MEKYKPRRVTLVSHESDLDGVASAVLAASFLTKDKVRTTFVNYDHASETIRDELGKCDELWIMDISMRDLTLLEHFDGVRVKFFDHHPDSRDFLEKCAEHDNMEVYFDDSGTQCTADIMFKYIQSQVELPSHLLIGYRALVRATHSIDLWIRDDDNGKHLSDVIDVLGPERVYELLLEKILRSQKKHFTTEMNDALTTCETNRLASIELAWQTNISKAIPILHNGEETTIHIHAARCRGFESEIAEKFRYDGNVMVALIPLDEGTLSLRTTEESIKATGVTANAIARACGGGGHPCAAGAPMPKHIIKVESLLDYVTSVVKELNPHQLESSKIHA